MGLRPLPTQPFQERTGKHRDAWWPLQPPTKPFLLPSRYHGEKLPTFIRRKKPRGDTSVVISTIYDDPEPQDMGDQLLRRQPPTAMKYRQDMAFVRASHPALGSLRSQPH